jgi:hypothetical protein
MSIDVTLYGGDNDNLVDVALARRLAKTPLTGAVVAVTIRDRAGTEVSGLSWPFYLAEAGTLPVQHPDGSIIDGARYIGTIDKDAAIVVDRVYEIELVVTHADAGFDGQWLLERVAQRRTG